MLICVVNVMVLGALNVYWGATAQVEGVKISENDQSYYVDFSKDLKKNKQILMESANGKLLIDKNKCVSK